MAPNLIERLDNLLAALDEAEAEMMKLDIVATPTFSRQTALSRIEDARGIAGELLTMIDGR
jgi:hypothetical protein